MSKKMNMTKRQAHNPKDPGSKVYIAGTKKGASTSQNAKRKPPPKQKVGW